jgi:hypothetical protein
LYPRNNRNQNWISDPKIGTAERSWYIQPNNQNNKNNKATMSQTDEETSNVEGWRADRAERPLGPPCSCSQSKPWFGRCKEKLKALLKERYKTHEELIADEESIKEMVQSQLFPEAAEVEIFYNEEFKSKHNLPPEKEKEREVVNKRRKYFKVVMSRFSKALYELYKIKPAF